MRSEFQPTTARSPLEIMEEARGLQAGHASRLATHAAGGLRRIVARVVGEAVRPDARDPA